MKKLKLMVVAFAFVAMGVFSFVPISSVGAENALDNVCKDNADSALCQTSTKNKQAGALVDTIIDTLLFIIGALSVIMIIVGGILYVISQGDSGNVTKAKNTILYSVVGLIVAGLAYAIVHFVIQLF